MSSVQLQEFYHSNSELFCHAAKEEICQSEEPRDRNIKDVSFFGFTTLAELQEKIRYFQELKQYEVWDRQDCDDRRGSNGIFSVWILSAQKLEK